MELCEQMETHWFFQKYYDPVRHGRSNVSDRWPQELSLDLICLKTLTVNTASDPHSTPENSVCFRKSALDTAKGRNSSEISSLHYCMLCCMLIELPVLYKKWIGFTQTSRQNIFDNLPPLWFKGSGPAGTALIFCHVNHRYLNSFAASRSRAFVLVCLSFVLQKIQG